MPEQRVILAGVRAFLRLLRFGFIVLKNGLTDSNTLVADVGAGIITRT